MTSFLPNIPQPGDFLDTSQAQLLANNQALDTEFGIDHYKFSDSSANQGFHNKATTPVFVDNPPTGLPPVTTTNPVFYAFQDTANAGVLQYSRGPSNAVPSPVTSRHSTAAGVPIAGGTTLDVFDFSGMSHAFAQLFGYTANGASLNDYVYASIFWSSTNNQLKFFAQSASANLSVVIGSSASIIGIKNNAGPSTGNNFYWTLHFLRIQT